MARVIVAPTARDDLDHLIKILKLPKSTRSRVRARLAPLEDLAESGSELQDRWRGFRFILGPWTWMLIVYAYDDEFHQVSVITIPAARSARSPTSAPPPPAQGN